MQDTTIGTQSMLVSLEQGLPRQSTQLKEQAKKIETDNHTEAGVVKANAHYWKKKDPKNPKKEIDGLQKLKDYHNQYKTAVHNLARYPYSGGFYLCPAASVEDLLKVQEKFDALRPSVLMDWADNVFPDLHDSASHRMGSLFEESDFPDLSECSKRFTARLTCMAIPPKEQVARIALISQASQKLLMDHADATSKAAIADLHKSIWKDLMEPLQQVVTVFEKDKPKIYESLLGNLMEIANIVPSYEALTADPNLMKAAQDIKAAFGNITTEHLRSSEEARKMALGSAKSLVASLQPFARKFV